MLRPPRLDWLNEYRMLGRQESTVVCGADHGTATVVRDPRMPRFRWAPWPLCATYVGVPLVG